MVTWIQLFESPFLTNPWLENKSSFFSFSTCINCVLYMPLDPSIKLFMFIEEWRFWFIDIVFWVCHYKVAIQNKILKKDFFFFRKLIMAHLYLLINLIKRSLILVVESDVFTPQSYIFYELEKDLTCQFHRVILNTDGRKCCPHQNKMPFQRHGWYLFSIIHN